MMRKLALVAALAVIGALAAMTTLSAASQAAIAQNVRFPISDSLFDPCTGETVDLDGTAHVVFELTITDEHGSLMFHSNATESGAGETTGAHYTFLENFSDHIEGTLINGQFTQTTVIRNLRLLTPGGGNNFFAFDDTFQVTANANADITVEFDHLTPDECR
jgi:hypothetical protein